MDFDFFGLFGRKSKKSKDDAKSRLQFVLVQDRVNCSPQVLEMLKNDILKVISNYMDIDEEGLDIQIASNKDGESSAPVLIANIPVKSMRKNVEQ